MTPEIKAVSFDVGGTLIAPHPSVGHVYADVAARYGAQVDPLVLNHRFRKAWGELKQFNHRREEWAKLVDLTFEGLWPERPRGVYFDAVYDRFTESEAWKIFDDAHPILDELAARGIALAIVSNWDERLRPLLARLDLAKYFEVIVVSCETGFTKPSPVIFEMASRKLGMAPEHILHAGDSKEHDLSGALAAGFQARWLDRDAETSVNGQIRSLLELKDI